MSSFPNPATPIQEFGDSDVPFLPTSLRAGDSWNWQSVFPNYPSNLYTLTYIFNSPANRFVLPGTGLTPPITADADTQTFDIQPTGAQTALCPADTYEIAAILAGIAGASAAGEQVTIVLQNVIVLPNLAGASGPVDTRSFVKMRLDMIEAALAGDTRPDVQEYVINGRQIRKISVLELEQLRQSYRNQYKAELRAAGKYTSRRTIGFRFNPNM